MIEVEIKVKISDPNQVRKRIEENKGVYKISLHHEDTYFNMPKGLRDFKQTDEALRLRKSIESLNLIGMIKRWFKKPIIL
jgi:predicted adenylyl cyclase CyaB